MIVLGIESSCDETGAGLVDMRGPTVLANVVASQHSTHAMYGGVVPELASREHLRNLGPVVREALDRAGLPIAAVDAIAVTRGPGLAGCLHLGLSAAKAMAMALDKPWVGVNHLEGHLLAAFLEHKGLAFPYLGLVVSGGHTSLVDVRGPSSRRRLESTLDDAAGEAFDKVAKLLDLGFPGGPALDGLAQTHAGAGVSFPKARPKGGASGFSYSGLKTAVRTHLEKLGRAGLEPDRASVAAGFRRAAVEPLVEKAVQEALRLGYGRVVAGGGVAANRLLRERLRSACAEAGLEAVLCGPALCADNGAMIAYAGGLRLMQGQRSPWDLGIDPNLDECAA
ncbi:MAG TPA: tRNA (adenosine(37)-N6)-threonylcarbamoyltransferase complex transferase subunit TsaD [bacterium]|jgi:N6-L-threonylcarbamoyladenine synthase|nr:tRNA (adenosine(37)-N6)-threonylcarbamoyltransferase complex transferase subunit TsaD [bacterium]